MNDTSSPGVGTNAGMESNATENQINPTIEPVTTAPASVTVEPVVESEPVAPAPTPIMEQPGQSIPVETPALEQKSNISVENKNKEEGKSEEPNNNEPVAKKKFPYAVAIIMVVLIIVALLYYFFWITPTRVFDKAINNSIDSVKNMINGIENTENDTLSFSIKTLLRTAGPTTKESPVIGKFDKLDVSSDVEIDLKEFNIGARLYSKLDQVVRNDNDSNEIEAMLYPKPIDINLDYIDDGLYVGLDNKTARIKTEDGSEKLFAINYERLNDAIYVFDDTKNRILDIIQENQLKRTLTTKKINDQTTLAIKVNCDLENEDIAKIYYDVFEDYVEDDEILTKLGNVFAMDKEAVRDTIAGYLKRTVQTDFVYVNLYMNLANTELIGLDVTVENYYVEISYLNGYYYIDVKIDDPKTGEDMLNIEVSYDSYYGVLKGIGSVTTKDTYLKVEFNYERITKEGSTSMIGNTLDFKFYEGDEEKPFCTLDCTLDTEFNKEIHLINPENSISLIEFMSGDAKKEEADTNLTSDSPSATSLKYIIKKLLYEYTFVYEKLLNNKTNVLTETNKEEFIDECNKTALIRAQNLLSQGTGSAVGDIGKMTAEEKKAFLNNLAKMSIKEKIENVELLSDENIQALLNILPMADQLEIVNAMTTEQIYKLSGRITNKQFTAVFNKMATKKKLTIVDELTKEQLEVTLKKISSKDQITLINKMTATQLESLLVKIDESYQLEMFNDMSTSQQITLLGKMSKERVTPMFDKVADKTKVSIVNAMTAAQLTDMLGKITEEQQLAVFDKMNPSQKAVLLGKMNKTQVQSMIGKVSVSDQVTLANAMSATQITSLLSKLTETQSLTIFSKMTTAQKITMLTKIPKEALQSMIGNITVEQQVGLVSAMSATQLAKVIDKLTIAQQLTVFSKMDGNQKIQMLVNIPAKNLQTLLATGKITMPEQIALIKGAMQANVLDAVIPKPTLAQQKAIFNALENADKLTLLVKISNDNLRKIFDGFTNQEVGGILQLLGSQPATVQQAVIGKLTPAQQQRIAQIKAALGA